MATKRNVLIVVDEQNDFCEGGALATVGAAQVCHDTAEYLLLNDHNYAAIIFSKDWHITPADHFKTWPEHCLAGTKGADFFWTIEEYLEFCKEEVPYYEDGSRVFSSRVHTVYKGQTNNGYSAWNARTSDSVLTDEIIRSTSLLLKGDPGESEVDLTIDVCGLVTEHCVRATVLDALKFNPANLISSVQVRLLEDLTVAYDYREGIKALDEMISAGAIMSASI